MVEIVSLLDPLQRSLTLPSVVVLVPSPHISFLGDVSDDYVCYLDLVVIIIQMYIRQWSGSQLDYQLGSWASTPLHCTLL